MPSGRIAALQPSFARLREAGAALPCVEESTWYGTPALKVAGRGFSRIREPGVAVVLCPLEEKALLLEAVPEIFFETDHYKGWPALLVRLDAISLAELTHRLRIAWRQAAPKKLHALLPAAPEHHRA